MNQAEQFCGVLNGYLMDRYGYKTKPATLMPGLRIHVSRSNVHLYVRLKPNPVIWGEDTLVIANLDFKQTRKGNGASLLKFLAVNAPSIGAKNLGIEQAHSLPMLNFVQKYNFKMIDTQSNWVISLNLLSFNIQNYNQK